MKQKIKSIPIPGLRNIKTAIAIVLCIFLYKLIGRESVLLAIAPVLICMQDSIEKSIKSGINRVKGTLLGGFFGFVMLTLNSLFPHPYYFVYLLCCFFGVVFVIYTCNLIGLTQSIVVSAFVFMAIMLGAESGESSAISYALNRTLDTIIGIVTSVLVNITFYRPKPGKFRGRKTKNPVLHYEVKRAEGHKRFNLDGSECTEIYSYPEESLLPENDFEFYLFVMEAEDGRRAFPPFPGNRFHLMLLEGESELLHKGYHSVSLGQYDKDFFKGDWETTSVGSCKYFNLLTGEDLQGSMERVLGTEQVTLRNDHFTVFYALKDHVKLELLSKEHSFSEVLNKGDFLLVSWFENGDTEYSISFNGEEHEEVIAIKIECRKEIS